MSQNRRNTISYNDGIAIVVIAVISAILAVLSDASPTGAAVPDIILVGALAAFVTWLGASAAWWALMAGEGIPVRDIANVLNVSFQHAAKLAKQA